MSDEADKLDSIVIEEPEKEDSPVDTDNPPLEDKDQVPLMSDVKWSEYVLSQFEDDEVMDGNPTVDGLRRVANKILGPIISSQSKVVQSPNYANNNHATVEHTIEIFWLGEMPDGMQPHTRVFTDCADVCDANTNADYAVYASATAATRAEGRALRKALQLKRVVAAEEVADVAPLENRFINNQQISFMNMMCERLDINVKKLINLGKEKYDKIEGIPHVTAVMINKYLSECQRGKDAKGNPKVIPDHIKGYDSNWRQG